MTHTDQTAIEFQVLHQPLYADVSTDCVVVTHTLGQPLQPSLKKLDESSGGCVKMHVEGIITSRGANSATTLTGLSGLHSKHLIILGQSDSFEEGQYHNAIKVAIQAALALEPRTILVDVLGSISAEHTIWCLKQIVLVVRMAAYTFTDFLTTPNRQKPCPLQQVMVIVHSSAQLALLEKAKQWACATANGCDVARYLGNVPGNVCTPRYLADFVVQQEKKYPFTVHVHDEHQMKKWGMNALLAVAAGSHQPPQFIEVHYNPQKKTDAPTILVGKGITFDSGGISLKPRESMDEMKFDMCGAASVIGTLIAIAQLQLPISVIGLIPTAENMPGGGAARPGDIVRSFSGQTIEILDTDAEGRLILCDALSYAERFNPKQVVDMATLTGACVVALGQHAAGLMGNTQTLIQELAGAGQQAHDRAWPLPLWEEYQEQLKSTCADTTNLGGRWAGCITAGCFLSRFTKNYPWAHLDIAGVAWQQGKEKGATGRPVALLTQWLYNQAYSI